MGLIESKVKIILILVTMAIYYKIKNSNADNNKNHSIDIIKKRNSFLQQETKKQLLTIKTQSNNKIIVSPLNLQLVAVTLKMHIQKIKDLANALTPYPYRRNKLLDAITHLKKQMDDLQSNITCNLTPNPNSVLLQNYHENLDELKRNLQLHRKKINLAFKNTYFQNVQKVKRLERIIPSNMILLNKIEAFIIQTNYVPLPQLTLEKINQTYNNICNDYSTISGECETYCNHLNGNHLLHTMNLCNDYLAINSRRETYGNHLLHIVNLLANG